MTSPRVAAAQGALLAWYHGNGRDLPWRRTADPYCILVAEVMLQQTQVDRVLPKYREFLTAFPTVQALAAAPRGEVIRRWAPLGYNLRAVRLQVVAQQVVERWGGRFPEGEEDLRGLKGIGPYTAGAIRCFAFHKPAVFLDTNLRRVLGRCFTGRRRPRPADDREILNVARGVLPADQAYEWHQALMDLGATVCTAARPKCPVCPLASFCQSRQSPDDEALRVAEERTVYQTQPAFNGSRRFYRGRAVSLLRDVPAGAGLEPAALGGKLKPGWSEAERGWLEDLIDGLVRDGLAARLEDGRVALP